MLEIKKIVVYLYKQKFMLKIVDVFNQEINEDGTIFLKMDNIRKYYLFGIKIYQKHIQGNNTIINVEMESKKLSFKK